MVMMAERATRPRPRAPLPSYHHVVVGAAEDRPATTGAQLPPPGLSTTAAVVRCYAERDYCAYY